MLNLDFEKLKKALYEIEENTYQNLCILESSNTNPVAIFRFDAPDKKRFEFKSDYNKFAQFVSFTGKSKTYYKFSFAINLNTPEDREEHRKGARYNKPVMTFAERGAMNRPVVEAYTDGLKIPDDECYISIFHGGIDVYVPRSYFKNEGVNFDLMINKYNNLEPYFNAHIKSQRKTLIDYDKKLKLKKENLSVFKNGLYLMQNEYNLIVNEGKIYLEFPHEVDPTDKIEIVNHNHCLDNQEHPDKEDNIITFKKDLMKDLPIAVDNIFLYVNGRRKFPEDLTADTARHFYINEFEKGDDVVVKFYHNKRAITDRHSYIDDVLKYFYFRNEENTKKILKGELVEGVPDFILNREFPPKHIPVRDINTILQHMPYKDFVIDSLKKYIKINPNNFRYILKYFSGHKDYIFKYEHKSIMEREDTTVEMGQFNYNKFQKKKVVFSFKTPMKNFHPIIFINDSKVYEEEFLIFKHLDRTFVYVDSDLIKDNDVVRIKLIEIFNKQQKYDFFKITEENIGEMFFEFPVTAFGDIRQATDIFVMKRTEKGNVYMKYGSEYIPELTKDGKLRIYIGKRVIGEEYIVYNASFYEFHEYRIPEEILDDEVVYMPFDIYDTNKQTFIPKLSNYSHLIYLNRQLMIEGLDYSVSYQNHHKDIELAKIVFRKMPKKNDRLEVYHVEQSGVQLHYFDKVDNPFGIIRIPGLPFPISPEYVEIIIDGIKLLPDDYEIISDDTIMVINPNIKRPFINVVVNSKLIVDVDDFGDLTDVYDEVENGWKDWIKDQTEIEVGEIVTEDDKEIIEKIPDTSEEKEDKFEEEEKQRIDPFLSLVARMLRDGHLSRRLDANQWVEIFNAVKFIELMSSEQLKASEVLLTANTTKVSELTAIDSEGTLKPISEVIDIITRAIDSGEIDPHIDFGEELKNYEKMPISEKLYQEELSLYDGNQVPELDVIVFNANDVEEKPVIEEIRTLDLSGVKPILSFNMSGTFSHSEFFVVEEPINSVISVEINGNIYNKDKISYDKVSGSLQIKDVKISQLKDNVVVSYLYREY